MMKIKSPVTHSFNTSLITQFEVSDITKQYADETKLDVKRFFEGLQKVELYKCNDTGYRFYLPTNIWGDGKFYEGLEEYNKDYYPQVRWEHNLMVSKIDTDKKVLEIGCGEGAFLKMMLQKGITNIEAIELNEKAAFALCNAGFKVNVETIETFSVNNKEQYDVVCFFQVLEHIYDVKSFIDAALLVLKKGGKMVIAVPNNNPYLYKHDINHTLNLPPHHAGLWNKEAFENLEKFYPIKLKQLFVRPLDNIWAWSMVQKKYYRKKNPVYGFFISLIPTTIFSIFLSVFKQQGRDILVEFEKI